MGMATRAGYSPEEAACLRYEQLLAELADSSTLTEARVEVLQAEKDKFGTVPESKQERKAYFKAWLEEKGGGNDGGQDSQLNSMLAMLQGGGIPPQLGQSFLSQAGAGVNRKVRVKDLDTLKQAVDAHSKLQWDDRLQDIAGKLGDKIRDDTSDDTSQVTFEDQGFTCWLPTEILIDEDDTRSA